MEFDEIRIKISDMLQLLRDEREAAVFQMGIDMGIVKEYISERKFKQRFPRELVEMWIREGLIKPVKNGGISSTKLYSVIEGKNLLRRTNTLRHLYKTVLERKEGKEN